MILRRTLVVAVAALWLLLPAVPAAGHTGLESSKPAAGAEVEGPVRKVVLTFNTPIELAGAGVELLDGSGESVAAEAEVDGAVVTVVPREPLDADAYGVKWAVRSGDAHPVRDNFTFTVAGPPATTEPAPGPEPDVAMAPAPTADTAASVDETAAADRGATEDGLAAALTADPVRNIRQLDQILRGTLYASALAAIGVLLFLVAAWDGARREARVLTRLVARLAGMAALVAVAQVYVRAARTAGGWSDAVATLPDILTGTYGAGVGLRVAGAVLLLIGVPVLRRALVATAVPIAGGAIDLEAPVELVAALPTRPTSGRLRAATVSLTGVALLVGSFALIGHAASTPPRIVSTSAVVAHVLAGAAWGGGLLALAVALTHRRRAHMPLRAGRLATRFSVIATVGVVLAGAAGTALALVRLGDVSELWTTAYGLVLVAKVGLVAVVAGIGAYNHFVVVPALAADEDHDLGHRLRLLGTIEVTLLVAVTGLTSFLVSLAD